jgi:hypothetical protein
MGDPVGSAGYPDAPVAPSWPPAVEEWVVTPGEYEFEEAVGEFRASADVLDAALSAIFTGNQVLRSRVSLLARDVYSFGPVLGRAHRAAWEVTCGRYNEAMTTLAQHPGANATKSEIDGFVASVIRRGHETRERDLSRLDAAVAGTDTWSQLGACVKSMAFFVRAYQDVVAGAMIRALKPGVRHRSRSSMATVLNDPNHDVTVLVTTELPAYKDWFFRWRDIRNDIKFGAAVQVTNYSAEVMVVRASVITDIDPRGGAVNMTSSRDVSLPVITEAISMSAAISRLAAAVAERAYDDATRG